MSVAIRSDVTEMRSVNTELARARDEALAEAARLRITNAELIAEFERSNAPSVPSGRM